MVTPHLFHENGLWFCFKRGRLSPGGVEWRKGIEDRMVFIRRTGASTPHQAYDKWMTYNESGQFLKDVSKDSQFDEKL